MRLSLLSFVKGCAMVSSCFMTLAARVVRLVTLSFLFQTLYLLWIPCLLFLSVSAMAKIRKYEHWPSMTTMSIFDGIRVKFVAHYYPAKGYYAPRYHFENFDLSFSELNYEVARFVRFICKITADPTLISRLDYVDSELDGKNLSLVNDNQLFPEQF